MKSPKNGFTLVELAIVLMIIGLLIGGVLRGQELMKTAQITATIQQVKAYQGATVTFRDSYAALPGDFINATNRISGCTSASNCANGDGDGIIGTYIAGTDGFSSMTNTLTSENTQFWKHLAFAHLISGIDPTATTPDWGKTQPSAKTGGGFFVRYANSTGANMTTIGHFLVLRNTISGAWQCITSSGSQATSYCALSPLRAVQIDRKMDDGVSNTGDILANSTQYANGCGTPNIGTNGPNGYNETQDFASCDMIIKLN